VTRVGDGALRMDRPIQWLWGTIIALWEMGFRGALKRIEVGKGMEVCDVVEGAYGNRTYY
jgi:hypothetical protein